MMLFLAKLLKLIAGFLNKISDKILRLPKTNAAKVSIQTIRVKPWLIHNGDKNHRVNYDLDEHSIVLDLGGYEGQWAADIFCKYACTIYIFEPFKKYAKNIKSRFKSNPKVMVYDFGLTKTNAVEKLFISAESSSIFKSGTESVEITLVKIDDFLDEHDIGHIHLMKINIEGGEYDLLEHLVQSERILNIENIQVQFHDFVPNAEERMHAIQDHLNKTHYLTYQYEFIWENWKRKS